MLNPGDGNILTATRLVKRPQQKVHSTEFLDSKYSEFLVGSHANTVLDSKATQQYMSSNKEI
jgi:hypothetical protein